MEAREVQEVISRTIGSDMCEYTTSNIGDKELISIKIVETEIILITSINSCIQIHCRQREHHNGQKKTGYRHENSRLSYTCIGERVTQSKKACAERICQDHMLEEIQAIAVDTNQITIME